MNEQTEITIRTEKQRQASRKNGAKSSGPTTRQGKATASMNALKHGLTSTRPIIQAMEDERDWEHHLNALIEQHQPLGYQEETLVRRIAENEWRLRRAARAETEHLNVIQERAELKIGEQAAPDLDPLIKTVTQMFRGVTDDMDLPSAEEFHRIWQMILNASDEDSLSQSDAKWALAEALPHIKSRLSGPSQAHQTNTPEPSFDEDTESSSDDIEPSPDSTDDTAPAATDSPGSETQTITVSQFKELLALCLQAASSPFAVPQAISLFADTAAMRVERLRRKAFHESHDLDHYRRLHLLPDDSTMRAVIRAESHCRKMLKEDIRELERLQSRRPRNNPPASPLVVSVQTPADPSGSFTDSRQ